MRWRGGDEGTVKVKKVGIYHHHHHHQGRRDRKTGGRDREEGGRDREVAGGGGERERERERGDGELEPSHFCYSMLLLYSNRKLLIWGTFHSPPPLICCPIL